MLDTSTDPRSTEHPTNTTTPKTARRVGLALAGLLLLGLVASLIIHLAGRSQYREAVERFQSELSSEIPNPEPAALKAQIASFAPDTAPDLENAARFLVAGGQAIVFGEGEVQIAKTLVRTPIDQWTADQIAQARSMVERNRGGFETMSQAVPLAVSDYGVAYDDIVHSEIPNLIELMRASFLLNLEVRLAFADGEIDRGLAALDTLARLNSSLRQETILIFSLVAHVTEKSMLAGIATVLTSTEPWATDSGILERLEGLLPSDDLLAFGKRIVALDAAVVSVALLEGWSEELLEMETRSRLSVYLKSHWQAARFLDKGRSAATLSHQPYAENRDRFTASKPSVKSYLDPAYRNAVAKGQLAMSQRELVRAALDLRRSGLDLGAYPNPCPTLESLQEPDPFAGQPLLCEPRADGSLHLEIPKANSLVAEISPRQTFWVIELDLPAPPAVDSVQGL